MHAQVLCMILSLLKFHFIDGGFIERHCLFSSLKKGSIEGKKIVVTA